MGRLSSTGTRRFLRVLALSLVAISGLATWALATGPGGWDHLGTGNHPGGDSLDLVASAIVVATPNVLLVGGEFTDAGGVPNADRIALWNGLAWTAISSSSSQISNGRVSAITASTGKIFAGGNFQNAGGNADADNLAVFEGGSWQPFCDDPAPGPAFDGNVTSLQIIGQTLYVGGEFHDGAHIPSADFLIACDLDTGAPTSTVVDEAHAFSGSVYALAADSDNTLYAGGGFINLNQIAAADNVAALPHNGTWEPMGPGITTFVRGLTTVGTDVYVGTDANDVGGIAQADHVAKWDGSDWSALGANSAGTNGWFPTVGTSINALASDGSHLFATGSFLNADGDARADNVAWFDGTDWHPVGSDGAGNGPWSGTGLALAVDGRQLYAAGSFTSAGGDPQAHSAASFSLSQIIAFPTPTVTPGPSAVPTPTVTPSPSPTPPPPDVTPPKTRLRAAQVNSAKRKATFRFGSGEKGSKFLCKLDKKKYKRCTSPKTYKKLKPGKHVFRVKARDRAGNVDRTPMVKRFRISRR